MKCSFEKYSAQGNNFILVDELDGIVVPESVKADFAILAQDFNFGIGADDVLFLQHPSGDLFEKIQNEHSYWQSMDSAGKGKLRSLFENPHQDEPYFVFRIFDPDGTEALTCGNGLRCAADYLNRKLGLREMTLLAEVPSNTPRAKLVRTTSLTPRNYEVNMGALLRPPAEYVGSNFVKGYLMGSRSVGIVRDYGLPLQRLFEFVGEETPSLIETTSFITYTGELHLAFFCGNIEPLRRNPDYREGPLTELLDQLFPGEDDQIDFLGPQRSALLENQLFTKLAMHFNDGKIDELPQGLNVNIGKVMSDKKTILYRVFERLKNREVYSCGSGAVAIAAMAQALGLTSSKETTVIPVLGQSFQGSFKGHLHVRPDNGDDYWLSGPVEHVFSGVIDYENKMR